MVRYPGMNANICGTVVRFFLYGEHNCDTYGTGGELEISQEPGSVYENVIKSFPLRKLDRAATLQSVNAIIKEEEEKLVWLFHLVHLFESSVLWSLVIDPK